MMFSSRCGLEVEVYGVHAAGGMVRFSECGTWEKD